MKRELLVISINKTIIALVSVCPNTFCFHLCASAHLWFNLKRHRAGIIHELDAVVRARKKRGAGPRSINGETRT